MLAALVLAVALGAVEGVSYSGLACHNPIFKGLWHVHSNASLLAAPTAASLLPVCSQWQNQDTCCHDSPALSSLIISHLKHWGRTFAADMTAFKRQSALFHDMMNAPMGLSASQREALVELLANMDELFDRRLFEPCYRVMLEYAAGALCFACDPEWPAKTFYKQKSFGVVDVSVAEGTCTALWSKCKTFAKKAWSFHLRLLEDPVATSLTDALPFFAHLRDQPSLCNHLKHRVAFHPLGLSSLPSPPFHNYPDNAIVPDTVEVTPVPLPPQGNQTSPSLKQYHLTPKPVAAGELFVVLLKGSGLGRGREKAAKQLRIAIVREGDECGRRASVADGLGVKRFARTPCEVYNEDTIVCGDMRHSYNITAAGTYKVCLCDGHLKSSCQGDIASYDTPPLLTSVFTIGESSKGRRELGWWWWWGGKEKEKIVAASETVDFVASGRANGYEVKRVIDTLCDDLYASGSEGDYLYQ
ncbi:unnamed protein product [Vitrella brassicaformis CCMP3155]|uniref:Uncharacterized protein n=1 Tax=Vitrella brassicaformis (strain CCMP3155) TaxID=1169540 RepID=A0A0G4EBU8_VITBC|nr:unnamed protein product [Vitrella brassicaformis CCMP3155]|eukprot:CEL92772.1 unnamed protein product [Vitrella brassicaformis CCMP3155]